MNKLLRVASLLTVFALGANSISSQEPVRLRLKFETGESLRYRLTQEQTVESEMIGALETTSTMVFRQDVVSVTEDGIASMNLRYEAVKLDMGGPAPKSYDSTRTGEDVKRNDDGLARMFGPMLESELGMRIEPTGHVLEITGFDEMLEAALGASKEGDAPQIGAMLKEVLSEDALRKMVEINVFPGEPLQPGATWTRSLDQALPMLGTLKLEFENTFVGVETHADLRCAKIGVAGKLTFQKSDEPTPIPMEVSLEAPSLEGEMFLCLDNGRLIESRVATTMDMHLAATDEDADGFAMDMRMSVIQRMRLLGKDDPLFE